MPLVNITIAPLNVMLASQKVKEHHNMGENLKKGEIMSTNCHFPEVIDTQSA